MSILKFFKKKIKVKIKNSNIYITHKGLTYKEKFSTKNADIIFMFNLMKQLYFRTYLNMLAENTYLGYKNNAMVTAMFTSQLDIISKSIIAKIKNNKKSSHIFIINWANYNKDCLLFDIQTKFSLNMIDMIYTFISCKIKSKGDKYERTIEREQD